MKSQLQLAFTIGALIVATRLNGARYSGTVISVDGDVAKVAMSGDVFPPVGAHAEIFFKIAGSDDEISVATGSALKIDHGDLLVKIESATGTVEKNHLVRFASGSTDAATAPNATPKFSPPPVTTTDPAGDFYRKGSVQFSSGDYDGAIASYTEAIRLAPTVATFYLGRATAYRYKLNFRAALADANKALELKVEAAEDAYGIRGSAEVVLGDFDAAIADFTRALEIKPDYAAAYNNRANAKLRKRDYAGVLADCNQALALDPNESLAYYNRGYAYYNTGKHALALADWKRAVQLQPALGTQLNGPIAQLEKPTKRKR